MIMAKSQYGEGNVLGAPMLVRSSYNNKEENI